MNYIEQIAGSMFVLIFLYLIIKNASAADNLIKSVGNGLTFNISALQGNRVA